MLEPRLNKQGARWKDAEEYFQDVDAELVELTTKDLSDDILLLAEEVLELKKLLGKRG